MPVDVKPRRRFSIQATDRIDFPPQRGKDLVLAAGKKSSRGAA